MYPEVFHSHLLFFLSMIKPWKIRTFSFDGRTTVVRPGGRVGLGLTSALPHIYIAGLRLHFNLHTSAAAPAATGGGLAIALRLIPIVITLFLRGLVFGHHVSATRRGFAGKPVSIAGFITGPVAAAAAAVFRASVS